MSQGIRRFVAIVSLAVAVVTWPGPATAQTGPLTASLTMDEPTIFGVRIGPLMLSPNLELPAIGYEDNVFQEESDGKRDWTVTLSPDLRMFARSGLLQAAALASNDFTYFQTYSSERFTGRSVLGRAELTLSRFKPWVAGAFINTRARASREIDLRARRQETELSTGLNVTVTPLLGFYAMAARVNRDFGDQQLFKGIALSEALSHQTEIMSGGARIQATPFTTVLLNGTVEEDRFDLAGNRDSRSREGSVGVEFSPQAVIRGSLRLGYRDFRPSDLRLPTFRGLTSAGTIVFQLFGRATTETTVTRQVQYSFEEALAYFIETGIDLVYTHRITGPFDFQVEGSRRQLDYSRVTAGLKPVVNSGQVGLGYNFRDNSRVGLNYEYTQRLDDLRRDRRFNRSRIFGSYTYRLR